MSILTVVDGAVDGDGPHAGGVSVTVAVIFFTPITARPNVDVTETIPTLSNAKCTFI
jgi:hypothetical protein